MKIFSFRPNIEKLERRGDVKALTNALKHENILIRSKAVMALGNIKDSLSVEPLIAALRDIDPDVRSKAAVALGKIGGARAMDALCVVLKDEDSYVREAAAEALGKIGDARAVDPLVVALRDKDPDVRKGAAEALGEIGNNRAIEALCVVLKNEGAFCAYEATAKALKKLGWQAIFGSEKDLISYYGAAEDIDKLKEMGTTKVVVERLMSLFRSIPYQPATEYLASFRELGSNILIRIRQIGGSRGQKELIKVMKERGAFCKIARDLLNSGTGKSDYEHCLCPKCYNYLGIRHRLIAKGIRITEPMREEARKKGIALIGEGAFYRCPRCHDSILV